MPVTAKSVIFDIATNYNATNYTNIRSIDFWFNGEKITMTSGFTAYATSYYTSQYVPAYAFNTSLDKIDSWTNNSWFSNGVAKEQRLIIVFTTPLEFDKIIINNGHNSGFNTDRGARAVVITASTDDITNTTYGATITNATELFDGEFLQHTESNIEDPQTVYDDPAPVSIDIDFQEPLAEIFVDNRLHSMIDVSILENASRYNVNVGAGSYIFINFYERLPELSFTLGDDLSFKEPLPEINISVSNPAVINIAFNESKADIQLLCSSPLLIDINYEEPLAKYEVALSNNQSINISFVEPLAEINSNLQQATMISLSFIEPMPKVSFIRELETDFNLLEYQTDRCH